MAGCGLPQTHDSFGRTVVDGWGTAPTGGDWSTSWPDSRFAVDGDAGSLTLDAGVTVGSWLEDVSLASTEVQTTVSVDKVPDVGGVYVHVQGRRVSASEFYSARVKLLATGQVQLHATVGNGTPVAGLTVPDLAFAAGDEFRVRVQVEGTSPTTVRAKVWKVGATEPAEWQVETTDDTPALQVVGGVGVSGYLSASATVGSVVVGVDDVWAGAVDPTSAGDTPVAAALTTPTGMSAVVVDMVAAAAAVAATSAPAPVVGNPAVTVYLPGGQELRLDAATGEVAATRYYGFAGQTVAVRTGPKGSDVTSLVSDPHGTATMAISNNVTDDLVVRRFDPFGNLRGQGAGWVGDHGFLDKPVDATGLTAVGARYYDGLLGKFISVDPVMNLADPQQWAPYSYANNNPIIYSDPTGLRPLGADDSGYDPRRDSTGWGSSTPPATNVTKTVTPPVTTRTAPPATQTVAAPASDVSKGSWWDQHGAQVVGGFGGLVVGSMAGLGCLAVTAGAGSVACLALAGAVGGAVGAATEDAWRSNVNHTPVTPGEARNNMAAAFLVGGATGLAAGGTGVLVNRVVAGVGARTAEAAADSALAGGRTTGAAAELRVGGRVITDVSTGGAPRVLNASVQEALDAVPLAQRAPWHGACAEMGCLSQALNSGVNPTGGSIRAVAIGTSNPGHGLPKVICTSCSAVLDVFGVGR